MTVKSQQQMKQNSGKFVDKLLKLLSRATLPHATKAKLKQNRLKCDSKLLLQFLAHE